MAKPVVDGLERDIQGKVRFTRVDVGTDAGEATAARYGIHAVPAFLVIDGEGVVIYKKVGGRPEVEQIKARLGL